MTTAPPREEPLDLLMACHARIRRHLDGLAALAAVTDLRDPRAQATAAACLRYFRDGLPLHGEDEDLSVAPRLLVLAPGSAATEAIATMAEEHVALHAGLPDLFEALGTVAAGRWVPLTDLERWLSTLLSGHIELEERAVFPLISDLPPAERQAICDEIRARRRRA